MKNQEKRQETAIFPLIWGLVRKGVGGAKSLGSMSAGTAP